nr:MAG: hypothetical protein DIU70_05545 [Bacillota bacterium]
MAAAVALATWTAWRTLVPPVVQEVAAAVVAGLLAPGGPARPVPGGDPGAGPGPGPGPGEADRMARAARSDSSRGALGPRAGEAGSPAPEPSSPGVETAPGAVTLLVVGEVAPTPEPGLAGGSGDLSFPFGRVAPLIRQADIAVAHLPATAWAGAGPEGQGDRLLPAVTALARAGFDLVVFPGSPPGGHGSDQMDTLRRLEVAALHPLGGPTGAGARPARTDPTEASPGAEADPPGMAAPAGAAPLQVVNQGGIRFGLVAFRDGLTDPGDFSPPAAPPGPGAGAQDVEVLTGAIRSARAAADVVVVLVQWGPGAGPVPDGRRRELMRLAIEAGADLVLGVGPQAGEAVEWIRGRPAVYSLGRVAPAPGPEGGHPGSLARVRVRAGEVDRVELVRVAPAPDGQLVLSPEPAEDRYWLELEDRWARLWNGLPAAVQNRLTWAERLEEPATCPVGTYRVTEVRPDGIRLERIGYAASQFWITAPVDPAGCARVPPALLADLRERLTPGSPVAVTRRPSLSR